MSVYDAAFFFKRRQVEGEALGSVAVLLTSTKLKQAAVSFAAGAP
jgi:hypothetical protein